jgi:hypothetical protein
MARNLLAALGALTLVLTVGGGPSAWADTSTGTNCASLLVPTGTVTASGEIEADAVSLGCYQTYAEALYAGSGGSVQVSADTTPGSLTQTTLDASTTQTATSQVTIGTEFYGTGYSGTSQSYFASETCSSTVSWALGDLGSNNNEFQSGKGFGGCNTNKKFSGTSFSGSVLTCTPNCSDYGSLDKNVSSLKWKP